MYEGKVVGINDDGSFSIAFFDGDVDETCPAKFITRDNGASVPRPPSRVAGNFDCTSE
jgi:hypothetical protein